MFKGCLVVKNERAVSNPEAIKCGVIEPESNVEYTVRRVYFGKFDTIIWLEEIINPEHPDSGIEWGYSSGVFDIVQLPFSVQRLFDSCLTDKK